MKRFTARFRRRFWLGLTALLLAALPARAEPLAEVRRMITERAADTDVPASLALAVAKTGSGFRADHEGPEGARGVMQIMPETAESMGVRPAELWRPAANIELGLRILSHLLERAEGDWNEALRAYYSDRLAPGGGTVRRRVAGVLKWERRFAERLALQVPVRAPRRDVLAGRDEWRERAPVQEAGPDAQAPHPPAPPHASDWADGRAEDTLEVIVIERIVERPVFRRPPPRWTRRYQRRPMDRFARAGRRGPW